jgi:hypothetical protein
MLTVEVRKWTQDWKDVTFAGVQSFPFSSLQDEDTENNLIFETFL